MYLRTPFDSLNKNVDERRALYQTRLKDEKYEIKYEDENIDDIPENGLGLNKEYSDDLKALVKELLVRDPTKRLGYTATFTGADDYKQILEHAAFKKLTEENDGSPNDKDMTFIKP